MPKDIKGVMKEFKKGKLHSGSKNGPVVKNRKQAVAIAISEQKGKNRKKIDKAYKKGKKAAGKAYEKARKSYFNL